jgi:hypothetical protein
VAWKLIQESKIAFNDEQIDCIALCVWDLEEAFRKHLGGASSPAVLPGSQILTGAQLETIRSQYLLPNDLGLPRTLIVGGGGCGKTTMLLEVICPTYATFFERIARATPSNKSARLFMAKTIHGLNGLTPADSLRTATIRIHNEKTRRRTQAVHVRSGALFIDEFSQLQAMLYHANNLFWSVARQPRYNLKLEDYARPRETAGRVSKIILSGDHLQLPPVPGSSSLLASLDGTSDEHKAGAAMFANIEQVFVLETMMRFRDPVLIKILEKMRTLGGTTLSDEEWQALMDTNVNLDRSNARVTEQFLNKTADWYHGCYLWSVITLSAYTCAKLSAKKARCTLFYVQAIDVPKVKPRHGPADESGNLPRETVTLYQRMLQVANLSNTKRLPGWTYFHQGMRVRLTGTVLAPWAVQDSTGFIKSMTLHPTDAEALNSCVSPPTEYKLAYPPILNIKLDKEEREFLPPTPCGAHRDAGHANECPDCTTYPGIVQVKYLTVAWHYSESAAGYNSSVQRMQLPIMPEKACPLYGLQGTTADPGLIAHWAMPARGSRDIKWLIVYVMLSRVRGLDCLASFGLNDKIREIIESGPPEELIGTFERLFGEKAKNTRIAASNARRRLGWPSP